MNVGARISLPPALDRPAAALAIRIIDAYRKVLSSRTGRICLFKKSCSQTAQDYFVEFGWNQGIVRANRRLRICGGTYTLSRDALGRCLLITSSGEAFSDSDLSTAITCSCNDKAAPLAQRGYSPRN
jgi:putative component of membrane protein insertase Oxa1/YidC/SpoIIIJ protein YidD